MSETQIAIGKDERTQAHIVDLVVSNLYQNPLKSCFVETISNAIDAAMETECFPIRIQIPHHYDPKRVYIIQDFGPGMSPELIQNVYCQLGVSTKRNNESAIGTYGIGAMTVQNISDNVIIETVSAGIKYIYEYTKNNIDGFNSSSIKLISEEETSQDSGTKIICPIRNDISIDKADEYILTRLALLSSDKYELFYDTEDCDTELEWHVNHRLKEIECRLSYLHETSFQLTENIKLINTECTYIDNKKYFLKPKKVSLTDIPNAFILDCGGVPYSVPRDILNQAISIAHEKIRSKVISEMLWTEENCKATLELGILQKIQERLVGGSEFILRRYSHSRSMYGENPDFENDQEEPMKCHAVFKVNMAEISLDTSRENVKLDPITVETISKSVLELTKTLAEKVESYCKSAPLLSTRLEIAKIFASSGSHVYAYIPDAPNVHVLCGVYFQIYENVRYCFTSRNQEVLRSESRFNTEYEKLKTVSLFQECRYPNFSKTTSGRLLIDLYEKGDYPKRITKNANYYNLIKEVDRKKIVVFTASRFSPKGFLKKFNRFALKYIDPQPEELHESDLYKISVAVLDPGTQSSATLDYFINECPYLSRSNVYAHDERFNTKKPKPKEHSKANVSKNCRKAVISSFQKGRGYDLMVISKTPAINIDFNWTQLIEVEDENKLFEILKNVFVIEYRIGKGDPKLELKSYLNFFQIGLNLGVEPPKYLICASDYLYRNIESCKIENLFNFRSYEQELKAKADEYKEQLTEAWITYNLNTSFDTVIILDESKLFGNYLNSLATVLSSDENCAIEDFSEFKKRLKNSGIYRTGVPNGFNAEVIAFFCQHPITKKVLNRRGDFISSQLMFSNAWGYLMSLKYPRWFSHKTSADYTLSENPTFVNDGLVSEFRFCTSTRFLEQLFELLTEDNSMFDRYYKSSQFYSTFQYEPELEIEHVTRLINAAFKDK